MAFDHVSESKNWAEEERVIVVGVIEESLAGPCE